MIGELVSPLLGLDVPSWMEGRPIALLRAPLRKQPKGLAVERTGLQESEGTSLGPALGSEMGGEPVSE